MKTGSAHETQTYEGVHACTCGAVLPADATWTTP